MDAQIDFGSSIQLPVLGTVVPVMPLSQLVAYKSFLDREVDLDDIRRIRAARK